MLDLATLKASLLPIKQIGETEETFQIEGIPVAMRVLNPNEELEIQRWAQAPVTNATPEQQQNDNSLAVEYLNRFKLGCLAFSLTQVGDLDLRGSDYVTTGEVLQNGQAVKIKRTDAVRQMLEQWPRPLLSAVFRKFNEIMERCELNSDKAIEFDPPDIDTEIKRLLNRVETLEELKSNKNTVQEINDDITGKFNDAYLKGPPDDYEEGVAELEKMEGGAPSVETAQPQSPPQPEAPSERVSAVPTSAAPVAKQAPIPETPSQTPVAKPEETVVSATGSVGSAAPNDGWINKEDSESMEDAMAAETRRIQDLRSRRVPPHVAAKEAVQAMAIETPENTEQSPEPSETSEPNSANPRFVPPKKR